MGTVVTVGVLCTSLLTKRAIALDDWFVSIGSFLAAGEIAPCIWLFCYGVKGTENVGFPKDLQGFELHLCLAAIAAILGLSYGIWTCFAQALKPPPALP
jgi:hypothetical protein